MTRRAEVTLADRISRPFLTFFEIEVASAAVLFGMAVVALVWANSPIYETYNEFWHQHLKLALGGFSFEISLGHFVNDALMAVFFFVVGLEIKREMVHGELSTRQRALLPIAGALGGMILPATIYLAFHAGGPAARGWGIPMATDIAFAVAAISLLGSRVPHPLKVFLLALAIADDLGAIAVIALVYTETLSLPYLGYAIAALGFVVFLRWAGVRAFGVYLVVGMVVWYCTYRSGVHATVSGVALGFLTPSSPMGDHETLLERGRHAVDRLVELIRSGSDHHGQGRHRAAQELRMAGLAALSPLDYLVNRLDRWVAFGVMPIFALANAGVHLDTQTLGEPMTQRVALAVAVGLVVGKPFGITFLSWVFVKTGLAALPRGVTWSALFGTGMLAGIGFTVALFVTSLAFSDPFMTAGAKLGILGGSLLATLVGLVFLNHGLAALEPENGPEDPSMG